MTAWLIAHAQLIYAAVIVGGFTAIATWETVAPLRPAGASLPARWATNISLLVINSAVLHVTLPVVAVGAAMHAQGQGWGLLNGLAWPWPIVALLALVLLDLLRWLLHVAMHRVPWLWRLHRVHHSDIDYDCSIGLRFHPLEAIVTAGVLMTAVMALGVPPQIVVLSEALTIALGFFAHGNVSLPPHWDRIVRLVLVTADMHRVHHSCQRHESMANFGSIFPFWDRLFGTHVPAPSAGHLGMTIGLEDLRDPRRLTVPHLLRLPLRRLAQPRPSTDRASLPAG